MRDYLSRLDIRPLFIEPGSPWENGYVESFNSKLRDEFLNRELFLHIDELRYVADRWRMDYNHYRPHSSLAYMTPAAFAQLCVETDCCKDNAKPEKMELNYGVKRKEILS